MEREKNPVAQSGSAIGLKAYRNFTKKKYIILCILVLTIILLSIFAINAGSSNVAMGDVFKTLFGNGNEKHTIIIMKLRMPRIIAGIVAGAGLSIAGCVMQNNLRNPLASPSTLGISSAAAFGANMAIILFDAGNMRSSSVDAVIINNPYIVTLSAFFWSLVAAALIVFLAKKKDFSPEVIILAGVAVGSLFAAGTITIQYFAPNDKVAAAVFWTFGDLGRVSTGEDLILTVIVVIATLYFMFRRWDYNAMDSGEESAKSLGVNVKRVRFGGMVMASMLIAVAVAFIGIIGFIGLIGPQIMRRIIGSDHRFLIPASALCGSAVLLLTDTIARSIIAPIILPVGVVTSFLGAPLFIYILMKGYK